MNINWRVVLFTLAFISISSPVIVSATDEKTNEKPWGLDASLGFYSDYIFRGKNVYDGISIEPSGTAYYDFKEYGNVSANVWFHTSGESNEPPEKFNEIDTTLAYGISLNKFDFEIGHIFYTFPGGEGRIADTSEFFGTVSGNFLLHPSFTFYRDYDVGKYEYYTLRVSEPFAAPLSDEKLTLEPYVMMGFASNSDDGPVFYFENGLEHIDVGLTMKLDAGRFYVSPNFNFAFGIDDALQNEFWMGIDIGMSV